MGEDNNTIRLINVHTEETVKTFTGHYAPIAHLAFNESGNRLVSRDGNAKTIVWDTHSGMALGVLPGPSNSPFCPVLFTSSEKNVITGYRTTLSEEYSSEPGVVVEWKAYLDTNHPLESAINHMNQGL